MGARGNWQKRVQVAPGLFLRRQLAEEAGVSLSSIIRWHEEGLLAPLRKEKGASGRWLYDEDALRRARRLRDLNHFSLASRRIVMEYEFETQGDDA